MFGKHFLESLKNECFSSIFASFPRKIEGFKNSLYRFKSNKRSHSSDNGFRVHLFPFRASEALPCRRCSACGKRQKTEVKLVYAESTWHRAPGRIGNCRISIKNDRFQAENGHFSFVLVDFLTARLCFCVAQICLQFY